MARETWWFLGIIVGGIAAYVTVRVLLGGWLRSTRGRRAKLDQNRCRCGYDLTGVAIPRCPECGRAIGFDKSFEELGLTEEEVRRLAEAKRKRDAQTNP